MPEEVTSVSASAEMGFIVKPLPGTVDDFDTCEITLEMDGAPQSKATFKLVEECEACAKVWNKY